MVRLVQGNIVRGVHRVVLLVVGLLCECGEYLGECIKHSATLVCSIPMIEVGLRVVR